MFSVCRTTFRDRVRADSPRAGKKHFTSFVHFHRFTVIVVEVLLCRWKSYCRIILLFILPQKSHNTAQCSFCRYSVGPEQFLNLGCWTIYQRIHLDSIVSSFASTFNTKIIGGLLKSIRSSRGSDSPHCPCRYVSIYSTFIRLFYFFTHLEFVRGLLRRYRAAVGEVPPTVTQAYIQTRVQ